jgi:hypothetical protein
MGGTVYDIHVDGWGPVCVAKMAKVVVCGSGGPVFEHANHMLRIW